jgi:hypothetical protein
MEEVIPILDFGFTEISNNTFPENLVLNFLYSLFFE